MILARLAWLCFALALVLASLSDPRVVLGVALGIPLGVLIDRAILRPTVIHLSRTRGRGGT